MILLEVQAIIDHAEGKESKMWERFCIKINSIIFTIKLLINYQQRIG